MYAHTHEHEFLPQPFFWENIPLPVKTFFLKYFSLVCNSSVLSNFSCLPLFYYLSHNLNGLYLRYSPSFLSLLKCLLLLNCIKLFSQSVLRLKLFLHYPRQYRTTKVKSCITLETWWCGKLMPLHYSRVIIVSPENLPELLLNRYYYIIKQIGPILFFWRHQDKIGIKLFKANLVDDQIRWTSRLILLTLK